MHARNRVVEVMHRKRHDQIWLNNSVRKSLSLDRKSRPLYCSYSKLKSGKSSKSFIYQLMHNTVALKEYKNYIKIDPTCFGLINIIMERII